MRHSSKNPNNSGFMGIFTRKMTKTRFDRLSIPAKQCLCRGRTVEEGRSGGVKRLLGGKTGQSLRDFRFHAFPSLTGRGRLRCRQPFHDPWNRAIGQQDRGRAVQPFGSRPHNSGYGMQKARKPVRHWKQDTYSAVIPAGAGMAAERSS